MHRDVPFEPEHGLVTIFWTGCTELCKGYLYGTMPFGPKRGPGTNFWTCYMELREVHLHRVLHFGPEHGSVVLRMS